MCGIAGYFGPCGPDDGRVAQALALMRRRGPDSQNARRFRGSRGEAVLLHARLSIIDLVAAANQPFGNGDGSLIFNGEIYNYIELRAQLEAEGVIFQTRSDTEVLFQVLVRWGWRGLDRCEGMWAFAFYDLRRGTLLLARDRFGEKPLFLNFGAAGEVWFGSEPKFIAALKGRALVPNESQVLRFLVNGYKSLYKGTDTFFRDVISLEPGHVLEIDTAGAAREFTYWTPQVGVEDDMSFDDAVAGTRERLIRSLEIRLRADVPLAFCMSGGVNSNACIGIASRVLKHKVKGFTIVNTDERYEEMDIVNRSVQELGIDHTEVHLGKQGFLEGMRELVRYHDAPVYTITYYVHWLLQKAISEAGFRISISGTGADEIFTGYYDHHAFYLAAVAQDRDLFDRSLRAWKEHIAPIVRNPVLQDPEVFCRNPGERSHIYFDATLIEHYLKRPFSEPFEEKSFVPVPLRNRMLNEMFQEAVPVILHEDDLNAMYYSVENRSPFLDRELFEFAGRIPTRHLIRDGAAKAVLREAIRGIAPDVVVDTRRKVGFNAPIQDLLDMNDPDVRRQVLADGPIFDLVDRDRISALMTDDRLSNSRSKLLFNFVSARLFLDTFAQ